MKHQGYSKKKLWTLDILLSAMGLVLICFLLGCEGSLSLEGSAESNGECVDIVCKNACDLEGYESGFCADEQCQCAASDGDTGVSLDDVIGDEEVAYPDEDSINMPTDEEETTIDDPDDSENTNIIAFHSDRDHDWEIYIAHGDGRFVTRVTTERGKDLNPCLSPDAEHIVFDSTRDGSHPEIYLMRRDGTSVTRLTNNRHDNDVQPVFSPDGTQIAFVSDRDGNREIYTMNIDGTAVTRLTNNRSRDEHPLYSPEGSRIFFISTRDDGRGEIYSMNSQNGTRLTRLTKNRDWERSLSISPDGERLAFASYMDGNWEIYTIDSSDGTGLNRLTMTKHLHEQWPSWSADGHKIYFSACGRDCNIYSMFRDGTGVSQLTYENRSEHPSTAYGRPIYVL